MPLGDFVKSPLPGGTESLASSQYSNGGADQTHKDALRRTTEAMDDDTELESLRPPYLHVCPVQSDLCSQPLK
jgi:hypothetical protein